MNIFLKVTAIAAASAAVVTAAPAVAAPAFSTTQSTYVAPGSESFNQYRNRHRVSRDDYRRGYGNSYRYRDARSWRGDDRRDYCRRGSGTTGLLIGGAAGALLGREIDGRGDRTLGTVLGAAGGALLGREVDRGGSRCR